MSEIPSIIDGTEDDEKSFIFVSILDAELYNGSPGVAKYYNNGKEINNISGIFIKNPVSMPELKELPNTGIVVFKDVVDDLIKLKDCCKIKSKIYILFLKIQQFFYKKILKKILSLSLTVSG